MKILIIGNAGFIGGFLTEELVSQNYNLVGLDINPQNPQQNLCRCITGNILKEADVLRAAEGAELVINLAAKHHDFGISKEEFFEVNVEGMRNLLNCAAKLKIGKLIFFSSVAVYGEQKEPTNEQTRTFPNNAYGESKLVAENLIKDWVSQNNNRSVVIVRPTVVFGAKNYANMYNLINNIYKRRFIFIGNGRNVKSVAYVENLIEATIFLLERLKPGVQIFNYSDEPQMTASQIVKTITSYLPNNTPNFKIPLRPALVVGRIFDSLAKLTGHNFPITAFRMEKFATPTHHTSDRIRRLGFRQRIDLPEGFRRMAEWYLAGSPS